MNKVLRTVDRREPLPAPFRQTGFPLLKATGTVQPYHSLGLGPLRYRYHIGPGMQQPFEAPLLFASFGLVMQSNAGYVSFWD